MLSILVVFTGPGVSPCLVGQWTVHKVFVVTWLCFEVFPYAAHSLRSAYLCPVPACSWEWKQIQLVTMRFQIRSLALFSGLRIWCCRELWCRLQTRLRSHIPVALAYSGGYSSDWTPSLGTSILSWSGPRNCKKRQKKKKRSYTKMLIKHTGNPIFFSFYGHICSIWKFSD